MVWRANSPAVWLIGSHLACHEDDNSLQSLCRSFCMVLPLIWHVAWDELRSLGIVLNWWTRCALCRWGCKQIFTFCPDFVGIKVRRDHCGTVRLTQAVSPLPISVSPLTAVADSMHAADSVHFCCTSREIRRALSTCFQAGSVLVVSRVLSVTALVHLPHYSKYRYSIKNWRKGKEEEFWTQPLN